MERTTCYICCEEMEYQCEPNGGCQHNDCCCRCLLKWSREKKECPLCRQPFDRILLNNVREVTAGTSQESSQGSSTGSAPTTATDKELWILGGVLTAMLGLYIFSPK